MKTKHIIIFGDARKMEMLDDASVHLIVTSPPYWQLKDYGSQEQIGFNDSYEDYINNLNLVWKESYRVLKPGCRLAVNIGDQFARAVYYGRYKVIPIRTEIIKFCETIGFDYMGAIIWQKRTTMNTTGGATVMGSYPYPRNGIVEIDYEFILLFKKPGKTAPPSNEAKQKSKMDKEKWKEYFSGHWYFNGVRQDKHLAMFPVELPKRLIEMFTFVGETVLDPFLGSGTTSLAASMTGRNSIGFEINESFKSIIEKKLNLNTPQLFQNMEVLFKKQNLEQTDWSGEIAQLPYVFKDPIRFEKKVDPTKLKFGSKITMDDAQNGTRRQTYFYVKKILAPDIVELSNGLKVKLLGVRPIAEKEEEAKAFLAQKILSRPVFLKYDEQKYDREDRLMAYLYLKNKTFINAHLIKRKLCTVDEQAEFKYKNKFRALLLPISTVER